MRRGPFGRHAATVGSEREHQNPSLVRQVDDRRSRCFAFVVTGTGGTQPGSLQRQQRFNQSGWPPVHDMIIGEHAAIKLCHSQQRNVGGMHSIVDALSRPRVVTRRHGRFEVDDPCVRSDALELRQRIAPYVWVINGSWDRAGRALRQRDIVLRRTHVALEQTRIPGMRKNLIDATACHDIAA